jgi:3-hydroxybutyryl-CoA dehydrogenase
MVWEGEKAEQIATEICSLLNKNPIRVPDQIGFVGARILASIIQEAVMLSDEGAASKTDIDLAMKLGTNYPRGPFEWAEAIGWEEVREVVERMRDEG